MYWHNSNLREIVQSGRGLMALCILFLVGCGEATKLDLKEKMTVAMVGVFESPQDADGNAEPRSMGFTLESVKLNAADGDIELYEDEPVEFSIINRSQIIAEAEVGDYVGETYTGVTVTFTAAVKVKGKIDDDLQVTLVNPVLQYVDALVIEKAKSFRLNIKVQWKNIITRDEEASTETATPPAFSLEIKYD